VSNVRESIYRRPRCWGTAEAGRSDRCIPLRGHYIGAPDLQRSPAEFVSSRLSRHARSGVFTVLCVSASFATFGKGCCEANDTLPFILVILFLCLESALLLQQSALRKRLERRLNALRTWLLFTWDTAHLGMLEVQANDGPMWANEQFRRLINLRPAGLLTLDLVLSSVHPDDRLLLREAIRRAFESPGRINAELRLLPMDAGPRWIALTLLRCHDEERGRGVVNCLAMEITDRKRMQSELLEQRGQLTHLARVSLLGELSSSLAHELNQPLTSILCNAEAAQYLLHAKSLEPDEFHHILGDIVRDDKRAGDVIRHMRALLTRGETHLQRVEIGPILAEVGALARSDLLVRNVRLRIGVPPQLPPVRADEIELQQVLLNLVLNACEAMSATAPADRIIEIEAAMAEGSQHARLSVLDRGAGIRPQNLESIFEPFFTTKGSGMGVGLAICRSIVRAHDGRIWATNNLDGGATLHFTIPVFEQDEQHDHSISESVYS
jgi:C4-dicarboxylate-specific signal transduction histidine kinase